MNLKNTALLTHKNCMDGSACAVLFLAMGGKKSNIWFTSPKNDDVDEALEEILKRHHGPILIADVSISEKKAKLWDGMSGITLLDHHKSAIPLSKFSWCFVDEQNSRCGSKMLYDFLYKEGSSKIVKYKNFVEAVDDHDRWVKQIPESDDISTLHNSLGQSMFISRFAKSSSVTLKANEQYLIDVMSKKREEYIENAKKNVQIRSYNVGDVSVKVGFVLANNHQSKLGHAIYEDPQMDVDAVVMIGNKTVSMRGKKEGLLDLSEVAKLNGGGGHKAAAGCDLSGVLGQDLVEMVINNFNIK